MEFKLDNKGNSPALFFKKKIPHVNDKILKKLVIASKKNKNCNIRICLHNNKKSKMHNMIVLLNKKNKSMIHFHNDTDEVYQIIKGIMQVNIFDKKKKKIKSYILSKDKNLIVRINSGIIHQTQPLTSNVIFCENRLKPSRKLK
tara:strand:- start:80 stop:511 length:432 start_codon:yes stop_codon:yes gene_type:complete